jgi:CPA2 family monovalent cation:H+ antiporter-2
MPHHTPLIGTIVAGLVVAFIMGAIAHRLRMSPLVGYLVAGIMVGPFTPGFVADSGLANELAEIGVILLMFGVGLHFSFKDLMSVKHIAVPGALVQIAVATGLGMGLSTLMGWPLMGGIVFGLALSVASTVVLLRALQGADLVETRRGRIAVGWLIVEDRRHKRRGLWGRGRGGRADRAAGGHAAQGGGLRRADDDRGAAGHSLDAALGRAYRIA